MSSKAILYVILSVILASAWRIIAKAKTKPAKNDLAFTAIVDGSAAIFAFIYLIPSLFHLVIPHDATIWLLFGGSLALATIGDYLILVSSKYADTADTSILLPLSNIWILIIAFLFLHETITPMKIIAVCAIAFGCVLALMKSGKLLINRGIIAVFFYGWVNAIMVNIDKGISSQFSIFLYVCLGYSISSLLITLCLKRNGIKLLMEEAKYQGWWITAIGFIWSLFTITILNAYRFADVSTIIPFMRLFIVITTIYSIFIQKEKDRMVRKIIGSIIVTAGAITLAYVG